MELKMDDGLKALLDSGKRKGLSDLRPGQRLSARRRGQSRKARPASDCSGGARHRADRRDRAEERASGPPAPSDGDVRVELDLSFMEGRRRPTHRRSGADVPDADGRDPAAHAASRKSRWPRRSKSPASASAAPCWTATTRCRPRHRHAEQRAQRRAAVRPHDQGLADRELEKEQILARMPHNLRTLEHLLDAEPSTTSRSARSEERCAEREARRGPRARSAPPPQDGDAGRGTEPADAAACSR